MNNGNFSFNALSTASDLAQFRVQRHFAEHRAVSPGTAIEYAPVPLDRPAFDRLRVTGVIREAHRAHYWFDLDRMGQDRSRKPNMKARVALTLLAVLALAAIWVFRY